MQQFASRRLFNDTSLVARPVAFSRRPHCRQLLWQPAIDLQQLQLAVCNSTNNPNNSENTPISSQSTSNSSSKANAPAENSPAVLAVNGALLALWAGLMYYVFFLAPNQTPSIDSFIVQKLVGLKVDDPFHVNEVFTAVWNFMALYPLIYAAILVPGARTNKLPAWPFVCAAVFLGAYALIPYMCLWSPKQPPEQLPPTAAELEGWSKFYMRAAETPWLPLGLIAGSAYWLYYALVAGGQEWIAYIQFFDESRLAHATSLDCMLCTVLLPFWMNNDALGRRWESRYTKLLMGNTTNVEH
eukprot:GHRR01013739.1.p1 GENE.GHRR01013739.1~~GHRR01013739.1.p1  ORF type:complete len:299 (+),score=83.87 GHRR01013739.1:227-1123(+)